MTRVGVDVSHEDDMPPLQALAFDLYGKARPIGLVRLLSFFVRGGETRRALTLIRLIQHFHLRGHKRLRLWADRRLRRDFGCFIQAGAAIGPGLQLPHPTGIVLGRGARIGANCILYHQVTLGGARRGDWQANRYPQVGDRVTIFAGAKLLGAIEVGDDAIIGANAVVSADVPARHIAKGVPARSSPRRDLEGPADFAGTERRKYPAAVEAGE